MKVHITKWLQSGAFMCGFMLVSGWQHSAADTVQDADGNIYHTVEIGNNHHHQRTGFSIRLIRDDPAN